MGSIGWYILGYFVLGVICEVVGSVALVVAAAISDIRWDMKNDKTMERADTTEALCDTASWANEMLQYRCQMTENPQGSYMLEFMKTIAIWPYSLPKAFTILWKQSVDLRNRRR